MSEARELTTLLFKSISVIGSALWRCTAASTAMLLRSAVVPVVTVLEQTGVKLQTVTGETASMKGRGTFQARESDSDFSSMGG